MALAQTLYEGGFITYMRTDSPAVSPEGVATAHATVGSEYGADYIGKHTYGAKGNAQEAHECIRPTDTATTPDAVRLELGADNGEGGRPVRADLSALSGKPDGQCGLPRCACRPWSAVRPCSRPRDRG